MIIVYPLTTQFDYEELRYSLRSLENFPGEHEIVVIGDDMPYWLNNITFINLPDTRGRKQLSIKQKIIAGIEYAKEEILFMNDDIYLLHPQETFPYYFNGTLKNYSESGSKPLMKELEAMGKPIKHFDGHYPIVYGRDFKEIIENFSQDTIIKSVYCNFKQIPGEEVADNKLLKQMTRDQIMKFIEGKPSFSTGYNSIKSALPVLEELFPNPSKYEI